ncbi:WRC domain-containing protein/QLQ domain-containing protein [Cephalotus follicularis]|uniref:Growth-regulating factor n=1 Tax=Cephalotus follicularis TaxID=3775 RepID=A0A1Q3BZ62_CEPFO|nr:WRC domain-containing protein/QLQ domain-containing protein [Cephalotus follicularis]
MDGFGVSYKEAKQSKSSGTDAVAVDFGVKLHSTESFPIKMMMMGPDNHSWCKGGVSGAVVAGGGVRILQPFDISPTKTTTAAAPTVTTHSHTAFKSPAPGVMAAVSSGFPAFTSAQWKELEIQAMIYKYMMASLPVPPQLLFPILRHPPLPAASHHHPLGRFSPKGGGDQEPGRCRRTDGKKWRCSRDVAPDQKYCERHMHRGRPRSRKHVELPANFKKTRLNSSLPTSPVSLGSSSNNNGSASLFVGSIAQPYVHTPDSFGKSSDTAANFEPVASASLYSEPSLAWTMKGESVPITSTDQQWQHLLQQTKIVPNPVRSYCNTNDSYVLGQLYREPLNLNSYEGFSAGKEVSTTDCPFFQNPELISIQKPHTKTAMGFIEAWPNGESHDPNANCGSKSFVSSNEKLSLSSLSLSVGGHDDMGHIQMGSEVTESCQNHEGGTKTSSWHVPSSWAAASTPGGPLAEVLRPSNARTASTSSSPIARDGDPGSPPATAISSPSGVLQKTLASLSDSSASSSPTLASSGAKPEIALMLWNTRGNQASSTGVKY